MQTIADKVRELMPEATDDEVNTLLWECTSFPFVPSEIWAAQIAEALREGGGTVNGACEWAYRTMAEGTRAE